MDLSRVIIFTPDVARLAEFYQTSFGLACVDDGTAEWRELRSVGCNIAFHHVDEKSDVREGWIKLVFGSADVRRERQRLIECGINMSEVVEFDGIQLTDGCDPDGNHFQISSRGYVTDQVSEQRRR